MELFLQKTSSKRVKSTERAKLKAVYNKNIDDIIKNFCCKICNRVDFDMNDHEKSEKHLREVTKVSILKNVFEIIQIIERRIAMPQVRILSKIFHDNDFNTKAI